MNREIYQRFFEKKKKFFFLLIVLIAVGTGLGILNPYIFGNIIDQLITDNRKLFGKWLVFYGVIFVLIEIIAMIETVLGQWITNTIENSIRNQIMRNIVFMNIHKSQKYEQGELLNRLEGDVEYIVNYYIDLLGSLLMLVVNFTVSLYFILRISIRLSVVAILFFPVIYLVNICSRNSIRKIEKQEKEIKDCYFSFIGTTISNLSSIKVFLLEQKILYDFREVIKKRLKIEVKETSLVSLIGTIRGFFVICLSVTLLGVSGNLIMHGVLTIGQMVAFNSYLEKISEAVGKIMELNLNQQGVRVSYERIQELENNYSEMSNAGKKVLDQKINKISLQNVFFAYDDKTVLNNMNMELEKPGLYTLVGANGSGKTTILKLLECLCDINAGTIQINQENIYNYTKESLRKQIAYMEKKPFFIVDTILENLRLGNKITDEDIYNSCKMLGIHEEIMKLKENYNTFLWGEGSQLSSGQKQKLGFARVLLQDASLYLLDEVTSDLDALSKEKICDLIEKLGKNNIIINVTHDKEFMMRSKKIFLLDKGRIVAAGTHEELLDNSKLYSDFYN